MSHPCHTLVHTPVTPCVNYQLPTTCVNQLFRLFGEAHMRSTLIAEKARTHVSLKHTRCAKGTMRGDPEQQARLLVICTYYPSRSVWLTQAAHQMKCTITSMSHPCNIYVTPVGIPCCHTRLLHPCHIHVTSMSHPGTHPCDTLCQLPTTN
jgi:hypothetical protein